jgi:hypothetical protein
MAEFMTTKASTVNTVNYTLADVPSIKIPSNGYLELGNGFKIAVPELIRVLKVARKLGVEKHPEEFV